MRRSLIAAVLVCLAAIVLVAPLSADDHMIGEAKRSYMENRGHVRNSFRIPYVSPF
jgi:hypothetical protein